MSMTFQSFSSRELQHQRPSRLQLLQADYQHKLLKEKEEKLIKILESEEQKNTQRFRRVTNQDRNDSAPLAGGGRKTSGHRKTDSQPLSAGSSHGEQRASFHPTIHKRGVVQKYGYDKSNPLAPIENHQESTTRANAHVLQKQDSLSKVPSNPLHQDDHRGAHSDSDLPNPRTGGGINPNRGTYKLSDFQKWRVEQDGSQKSRGYNASSHGNGDTKGSQFNGAEQDEAMDAPPPRGLQKYRQGGNAGDGGRTSKRHAVATASRTAPQPGPEPATKTRTSMANHANHAADSYDEEEEDVDADEAERQALIERLEAEHARKMKELEELRQRQAAKKDEQKKRLTRIGKQYSTDEDGYGDEDDDEEDGAPIKRDMQQQQYRPAPARSAPRPPATTMKQAKHQVEPPPARAQRTAAPAVERQPAKDIVVVDETGAEITMAQCPVCERSFAEDRLQKHIAVCEKTASKERKVFDATKQRLAGSGAEKYIGQPKRRDVSNRPKKDWRKQHEEFINNIRYAKRVTELEKTGGDLSSLTPPPPTQHPDYVRCQYCGRSFDPDVAARHVPKCKDTKNRPAAPPRRK